MNVQVSVQPTASSSDVGGGGGGNDSERGRARRPRMYGDPAIWGEETPALAPEQVCRKAICSIDSVAICFEGVLGAWILVVHALTLLGARTALGVAAYA